MNNIDWALFIKQKDFLVSLLAHISLPREGDRALLEGILHLMFAVEYEYKDQLYDRVLDQIKKDIELGDFTAIEELLNRVPISDLAGFLSETGGAA